MAQIFLSPIFYISISSAFPSFLRRNAIWVGSYVITDKNVRYLDSRPLASRQSVRFIQSPQQMAPHTNGLFHKWYEV